MYCSWPPVESVSVHLPAPPGTPQSTGMSEWEKYLRRPVTVDEKEFNGDPPTCAAFYTRMKVDTQAPADVYAAFGLASSTGSLKHVVGTRPDLWPIKMGDRDSYIHYLIHGDHVYYYYARRSSDVVFRLKPAR